jgi:NAD(P)-dependent dehydrogenase (short-subunit alcohol dehydrogenase family)
MGRLEGKRALMTGAGGRLGSEMCRAFAKEGADLVLTTRTASKLGSLKEEIRGLGRRAETIGADFTRPEDVDQLAEQAWDALGGIDVVVLSSQPTNAKMGDLLGATEENFRDQFETIVWGPLRLMRALAPKMMAAGGASIITFTSCCGFGPNPGYDPYGMAKAGLWWMTDNMAFQWGEGGIRANAIEPGGILTNDGDYEWRMKVSEESGTFKRQSLKRLGRNEDILGLAIYLASDESGFTTRQNIQVNGGRLA